MTYPILIFKIKSCEPKDLAKEHFLGHLLNSQRSCFLKRSLQIFFPPLGWRLVSVNVRHISPLKIYLALSNIHISTEFMIFIAYIYSNKHV